MNIIDTITCNGDPVAGDTGASWKTTWFRFEEFGHPPIERQPANMVQMVPLLD